jgi:hypothetical protein
LRPNLSARGSSTPWQVEPAPFGEQVPKRKIESRFKVATSSRQTRSGQASLVDLSRSSCNRISTCAMSLAWPDRALPVTWRVDQGLPLTKRKKTPPRRFGGRRQCEEVHYPTLRMPSRAAGRRREGRRSRAEGRPPAPREPWRLGNQSVSTETNTQKFIRIVFAATLLGLSRPWSSVFRSAARANRDCSGRTGARYLTA